MSSSRKDPVREVRIQAKRMIADVFGDDPARRDAAMERLRQHPKFGPGQRFDYSTGRMVPNSIQLKDALRVLAIEAGHSTWEQYKEALERAAASPSPADGDSVRSRIEAALSTTLRDKLDAVKTLAREAAIRALIELVCVDEDADEYAEFDLEVTNQTYHVDVRVEEVVPYSGSVEHVETARLTHLSVEGGELWIHGHYVIDPDDQAVDGEPVLIAPSEMTTEELLFVLKAAEECRPLQETQD